MKRVIASLVCMALLAAGTAAWGVPGFPGKPVAQAQTVQTHYQSQGRMSFAQGTMLSVATGKTITLRIIGTAPEVTWKSSRDDVASVNNKGNVRVKKAGVAIVSACNPRTGRSAFCTIKAYKKCTPGRALKAILSLKKNYRPGRVWTNRNEYFWQARQCFCYGCAAFAGIASDKAFGKFAPLTRHTSFAKIRAGDHVRIGNKHSVVVLYKKRSCIVVAEGNYRSRISWGRTIGKAELQRAGFYIETRY